MREHREQLTPGLARGVVTFSRRHIDLQRVAGALCPGTPSASAAVTGRPGHRTAAPTRTAA
ncbi:putative leader peptide [Actinacidiphila yanglinensis]|uniref:putative leader peptide n=1 Tax=Actinacidiphila yanglinensis TaxID=310779 RepID=UPI000CDE9D8B|nr:putative leader peptide [Actinacidiphila yanglinensis]